MAVKLPTTRRALILRAVLATGVLLVAYTAGHYIGFPANQPAVVETATASVAPPAPLETPAADTSDDSPAATAAAPEPAPAPSPVVREVAVASGDNLMGILVGAGIDRNEAYAAIQSLKGVYDPRRDLNIGDKLQITFQPAGQPASQPTDQPTGQPADDPAGDTATEASKGDPDLTFDRLLLPVSYNRDVAVTRGDDGAFSASEIERRLERTEVRAEGTIDSSLFVDGRDAGLPINVLVELIRIYSFDVDFQREIQPGDHFEVMYEQYRNAAGKPVHNGEIAYAKLTLSGTDLPLYRYETSKGDIDWFNRKGESVRKALMRTPIDGARLSSRFGLRKHPILGYSRMHAGVDFAAPPGTPIYAAGNGTIEVIGRERGYGNYIEIRHNSTYETAYGHMKAFARGMRRGKRVHQGQVIGYVGSTGLATGPHLHYEVHRNGKKINPLTLKLPSGEKLKGKELERFIAARDDTDQTFAALAPANTLIAGNEGDSVTCGGGSADAVSATGGAKPDC